MVSRRNFFTITIMMVVLFCMFQAPQLIKDRMNDYWINEHIHNNKLNSEDIWKPSENFYEQGQYSLFIGNIDSKIGNSVIQWGVYRKHPILVKDTLEDFENENVPTVIFLESEYLNLDNDIKLLKNFAENGTTVIFCDLPSYEKINENIDLQNLLGIRDLKQPKVTVEGYHLYEGFLLGGETIYKVKTEEDKEKQDMDLNIPWYYLGAGTEVYMTGILEDDVENQDLKREFWPASIWSHAQGKGKVFAVNGNYVEDSMGIGILGAMSYCANEYDVYPAVNAQILTVTNYPGFADENEEYMQNTYNGTLTQTCKNLIYPQLLAVTEQTGFDMTCMILPQYDYTDENEPMKDEFEIYLKSFKEQGFEAGLSLDYKEDTNLQDKREKDEEFFESANNRYTFSAAYTVEEKLEEVMAEESKIKDLRTMVCLDSQDEILVDYCSDEVTLLSITDNAYEHTYMDDLKLKSVETALGYSNTLLDMNRILWADKDEKAWEELAIDFASKLDYYWKPFKSFSKVTVSEADEHVRDLLNINYEHKRAGNKIAVSIENLGKTNSFIFRTHDEKITKVKGASYVEIEKDAYLIRADKKRIIIEVESTSLLNK